MNTVPELSFAQEKLQNLVNQFIPFEQGIGRLAEIRAGDIVAPIKEIADRYADSDDAAIERWFTAVDAKVRPEWPLRSWIISIQTGDDADQVNDSSICFLTIEAASADSQMEQDADTEGFFPPEHESREPGLDALYQVLQQIEDYETRNYLEYAHCIGYAALLVKRVLERRQWEMFRGRRVAVIWAGGDGVVLPEHLTNYSGGQA